MAEEVTQIVTCFLRHGVKICIFKRSELVGSSRGKWHGVSGYLPEGREPLGHALTEIAEETGLTNEQLRLMRQGAPMSFYDARRDRRWVVHPFLFDVDSTDIRLDWEHTDLAWIEPEEMAQYDCVSGLEELYRALVSEP